MTLEGAQEQSAIQVDLAKGHNRNVARVILAEVQQTPGQSAVDQLTQEIDQG